MLNTSIRSGPNTRPHRANRLVESQPNKETSLQIRPYNHDTDRDAVLRIWHEVGWIDQGNEDHKEGLSHFASDYTGMVAEIDNSAECYVATVMGSIRYLNADLSLSVVAAVTTSHVARRQGLAQRLTAASIARDAEAGAAVSGLGVFDQGFYDKLGYGTGAYDHWVALDPAHLRVPAKARPPRRITKSDWEAMHRARHNRMRGHGSCTIDAPAATRAEVLWATNGFGLGYNDGPDGELTHYVWFSAKDLENGPLNAWWMSYENTDQFLELMAAIANLGDQIHLVRMREPATIQLQDLIDQPFRRNRISERSTYESRNRSAAYMQFRICDVPAAVAAAALDGKGVRFNLTLTDPIDGLLNGSFEWRGVAGEYVVEFGPESIAVPGSEDGLPTLEASVGAFTRLWLGVRPASGLAATDHLSGPPTLLADLDRILRLPVPKADWDF